MAGKVKFWDIICSCEPAPECILASCREKQGMCPLAIESYNGAELWPFLCCAGFSSFNRDLSRASVYLPSFTRLCPSKNHTQIMRSLQKHQEKHDFRAHWKAHLSLQDGSRSEFVSPIHILFFSLQHYKSGAGRGSKHEFTRPQGTKSIQQVS